MAESFPLKIIFDAVNRTAPAFQSIGNNLDQLKNMAGVVGVALGAALAGIGVAALKNAADFETLEVKFKGLLGSAEAGKALAKTLADFASSTPFSLKGLSENAVQLLAFGSSVDELIPQLTLLGDLSAGVGVDVAELVTPFGRIKNANKATLIELDKFEDRGIPVIKRIAEMTGKSYGDIRKAVSDGAVDFKLFNAAINSIRTGSFNNAMAELSKTLGGKWANIIDATDLALAELGKVLINVFDIKDLADSSISFLNAFRDGLKDIDPKTIEAIKGSLEATVEVLKFNIGLIKFFGVAIYTACLPAITVLGFVVKILWEILAAWLSVTSRINVTDIASAFQAWNAILRSVNEALEYMIDFATQIAAFFSQPLVLTFDTKFKGVNTQVKNMIEAIQGNSIALAPTLGKLAPPDLITNSPSFSNAASPVNAPVNQQANLAITVDVKNGTTDTKVKSSQGFKIDKSKIKTGRIAQS
jgi:hypothetical protein